MIRLLRTAFLTIVGFVVAHSSTMVAQEPSGPITSPSTTLVRPVDPPARWEYLIVSERTLLQEVSDLRQKDPSSQASLSTVLSARGRKGWELITAIAKPTSYSDSNRQIYNEVEYLFKRPTQ